MATTTKRTTTKRTTNKGKGKGNAVATRKATTTMGTVAKSATAYDKAAKAALAAYEAGKLAPALATPDAATVVALRDAAFARGIGPNGKLPRGDANQSVAMAMLSRPEGCTMYELACAYVAHGRTYHEYAEVADGWRNVPQQTLDLSRSKVGAPNHGWRYVDGDVPCVTVRTPMRRMGPARNGSGDTEQPVYRLADKATAAKAVASRAA